MNWNADKRSEPELEPELQQALRNYRASVVAWSEAEYGRPRQIAVSARVFGWRFAWAGALGCVLAAGTLAGLYLHQRGMEQAIQHLAGAGTAVNTAMNTEPPTAVQAADAGNDEQQIAQAAEDVASVENFLTREDLRARSEVQAGTGERTDEELLAGVNSDLIRQVPRAMEPLAHLMAETESE